MRVITEKSKTDIGKRLAAIYYIALHGFGEDIGSNFESATKIIEHIYDIAYAIGGELSADIEIPAYVARFNEYMKKKNERKMNDFVSRQAAIEIIHCKDCIFHNYKDGIPYCENIDYGYGWKDDDFCSHAERKNDECH